MGIQWMGGLGTQTLEWVGQTPKNRPTPSSDRAALRSSGSQRGWQDGGLLRVPLVCSEG